MGGLPPAQQHILTSQIIDENQPGTILRDFATLLALIGDKGTAVSQKHQGLPLDTLAKCNAQMTHPLQLALKRPVQQSYPHIDALYLLLRAAGLGRITGARNQQRLAPDAESLESWWQLNPTERYFTLLETWLLRARLDILGHRIGGFQIPIAKWHRFFQDLSKQGGRIAGERRVEQSLPYNPGLLVVAMLELFGFMTIEHGTPPPGKGWTLVEVQPTPWGEALLHLLIEKLMDFDFLWRMEEEPDDRDFGELQVLLQPYFPAWRDNLHVSAVDFQDGIYLFRVSLGRVWRRIAIPAQRHLDDLSDSILHAFGFDHDHLYKFDYQSRFGSTTSVYHPYMDEAPLTTEVRIGDVPLRPGTSMVYLFDFGDHWRFDVQLERIDPVDPAMRKATIVESHGKAPRQYHGDDEEAEWEE
jgi:hypothetical protein